MDLNARPGERGEDDPGLGGAALARATAIMDQCAHLRPAVWAPEAPHLLAAVLAAQARELGVDPDQVPLRATAFRLESDERLAAYLATIDPGPGGAAWRRAALDADRRDVDRWLDWSELDGRSPAYYDPPIGASRMHIRLAALKAVNAARLRDLGLLCLGDEVLLRPDWDIIAPLARARITGVIWEYPRPGADEVPDTVDYYVSDCKDSFYSTSPGSVLLEGADPRHDTLGQDLALQAAVTDLLIAAYCYRAGVPGPEYLPHRADDYADWPGIHRTVVDTAARAARRDPCSAATLLLDTAIALTATYRHPENSG
ncbi:hypothetical protein FDG2_5485 [Candidatus Protofrankia californiensis]|uniref:Uncharacterized protein n=1 Tax=Candidatus Protofrankia californiensis TaxID=1839754 RepID=A0A1C3PDS5_9ACTN|nr:hypothetical protein FDG2_5485 [Candidatus Protofrankia californiensis]